MSGGIGAWRTREVSFQTTALTRLRKCRRCSRGPRETKVVNVVMNCRMCGSCDGYMQVDAVTLEYQPAIATMPATTNKRKIQRRYPSRSCSFPTSKRLSRSFPLLLPVTDIFDKIQVLIIEISCSTTQPPADPGRRVSSCRFCYISFGKRVSIHRDECSRVLCDQIGEARQVFAF
jgi:hypothetical protein